MQRRTFLKGLAGIFASGIAPAFVPSAHGVLMPVKQRIWLPEEELYLKPGFYTGVFITDVEYVDRYKVKLEYQLPTGERFSEIVGP